MAKIIISGNCFPREDIKYIENNNDLEIIPFSKLQFMLADELEVFKRTAQSADLTVVALFGTPIAQLKRMDLEKIGGKKVLWTFDSHHNYSEEKLYQKYFDVYYVVHSQYCDKFDAVKVEWLPACYIRFDVEQFKKLRNLSLLSDDRKYDVVFPHKPYDIGGRIQIVEKIKKHLNKLGLRIHLGTAEVGMPYTNRIIQSRVVLNVSLLDDLNIRNFEVWSLNRPLLTNKVTDHTRISHVNLSRTYFFKRNLSDFVPMLEKALTDDSKADTSVDILKNHMLVHRYVSIINKSLGTNYHVMNLV